MTPTFTFCTVSANNNSRKNNYIKAGQYCVDSILKFSKQKVTIVTNQKDSFSNFEVNRTNIIDTEENNISVICGGKPGARGFNMNMKLHAIKHASKLNTDFVVYMDCDGYLKDCWSDEIAKDHFNKFLIKPNLDSVQVTIYNAGPVMDRFHQGKGHPHPWAHVFNHLGYENRPSGRCPQETLLIYKNNDKLKKMLDYWETFEKKALELNIKTAFIAIPIGVAQNKAEIKFVEYGRRKTWCNFLKGMGLWNLGKHGPIIGRVC